jgi:hypothetical protein
LTYLGIRDDKSSKELDGVKHDRIPDLAVLAITRQSIDLPSGNGRQVLGLARNLPRSPNYVRYLKELDQIQPLTWAAHSFAQGKENDESYYRGVGLHCSGRTFEVMKSHDIGVTISVRLHGALQSLSGNISSPKLNHRYLW